MFQVVLLESFFAFLMNGEHAFDQHLSQVIERLGRLDAQQGCRQRVAFPRQHLPHPGGIERLGLGGELLHLAVRNTGEEIWGKQVASLRDGDQVCDEQLHMRQRGTGWIAFEVLPGGPERGGLDDKQGIQRCAGLRRETACQCEIDEKIRCTI